jgi:hypothetical protein
MNCQPGKCGQIGSFQRETMMDQTPLELTRYERLVLRLEEWIGRYVERFCDWMEAQQVRLATRRRRA